MHLISQAELCEGLIKRPASNSLRMHSHPDGPFPSRLSRRQSQSRAVARTYDVICHGSLILGRDFIWKSEVGFGNGAPCKLNLEKEEEKEKEGGREAWRRRQKAPAQNRQSRLDKNQLAVKDNCSQLICWSKLAFLLK